jgi:hypothetical protein
MGSASQSLMKLLPASWKNAILDHPTVRQFVRISWPDRNCVRIAGQALSLDILVVGSFVRHRSRRAFNGNDRGCVC